MEADAPRPVAAPPWWLRALPWAPRLTAFALAGAPLGVLYYLFWVRLGYPLDLEWMEGSVLMHGKRVLDGQALYGPPTADFASFLYTPLYPWLLAGAGRVFGLSYTLGRALSLLAFTATLSVVVRAVLRGGASLVAPLHVGRPEGAGPTAESESESLPSATTSTAARRPGSWLQRRWAAVSALSWDGLAFAAVALGAVAAAYDFTGGWYDLVRGDTLQLALSAGGLYVLGVSGHRLRGTLVAGTLLGLAFFAKQTAVFPIVAAGLAMPFVRLRYLPVLVAVVGAVAGLGTLLMNHLTGGWFWFYVFELHQVHRTDATQVWPQVPALLWAHGRWLYAGCLAAVVVWVGAAVWRRRLLPQGPLWLLAALGGGLAAAVGRSTQWSHENAFIPAVVFPAAFLAIAAAEARALLGAPAAGALTGWRRWLLGHPGLRAALPWIPVAFGVVHLGVTGLPDRRRHAPDARAFAEAAQLLDTLRCLGREGEVYVPYHPWYSVLAGGRGHGHIMNVNDVNVTRPAAEDRSRRFGDPAARRRRVQAARQGLLRSLRAALASERFVAVLHDRAVITRWRPGGARALPLVDGRYAAQLPGLVAGFRLERDLTWDRASPRTREGNLCGPRYLWRRIRPPPLPAGARVVFDFERTGLEGWTMTGTAFGRGPVAGPLWDPRRRLAQGLVAGAGGRRWLSSFHGGDAATGRLRSPPFRLDRGALWLRLGGGRDRERLRASLLVGGRAVASATGQGGEGLRTVRWDVVAYQGQEATLEVVDEATGSWGHLQLDEVWLVPRAARPPRRRCP